jgi:hypothetical protein
MTDDQTPHEFEPQPEVSQKNESAYPLFGYGYPEPEHRGVDYASVAGELEVETLLDDEQRQRVEALTVARALLTGEAVPTGIIAAFGAASKATALTTPTDYAWSLTFISDYILGVEGTIESDVESACSEERCACKIAAEFTTGEVVDVPAMPRATESEVYRHARKQDVSLRDAWNYFRDEGYDMSDVGSYQFDSTNPNDPIQEDD